MNLQDFLDNAYLEVELVENGTTQRIPISPAQIISSISIKDNDETIMKVKSNGVDFVQYYNGIDMCALCENYGLTKLHKCGHIICQKCDEMDRCCQYCEDKRANKTI